MANYRRGRINDEVRKALSEILREVKDPRVSSAFISITGADVTPDLKFAKIYYSLLGADGNAEKEKKVAEDSIPTGSGILDVPLHDTGSKWYAILSFFLPLLGLIAAAVFRKFNHIRNFKACRKGALVGLATIAAVILFFALMLVLAVI